LPFIRNLSLPAPAARQMQPEFAWSFGWFVCPCFHACFRDQNFLTTEKLQPSLTPLRQISERSIYRGPVVSRLHAVCGTSSVTRHHGCCLDITTKSAVSPRWGRVLVLLQIDMRYLQRPGGLDGAERCQWPSAGLPLTDSPVTRSAPLSRKIASGRLWEDVMAQCDTAENVRGRRVDCSYTLSLSLQCFV
jgi:hypothetical protein